LAEVALAQKNETTRILFEYGSFSYSPDMSSIQGYLAEKNLGRLKTGDTWDFYNWGFCFARDGRKLYRLTLNLCTTWKAACNDGINDIEMHDLMLLLMFSGDKYLSSWGNATASVSPYVGVGMGLPYTNLWIDESHGSDPIYSEGGQIIPKAGIEFGFIKDILSVRPEAGYRWRFLEEEFGRKEYVSSMKVPGGEIIYYNVTESIDAQPDLSDAYWGISVGIHFYTAKGW
jgi:hypothetical protein